MVTYGDKGNKTESSLGDAIKIWRFAYYVGILSIAIGLLLLMIVQSKEVKMIFFGSTINLIGLFCFFLFASVDKWKLKKWYMLISAIYVFGGMNYLLKLDLTIQTYKIITAFFILIAGAMRCLIAKEYFSDRIGMGLITLLTGILSIIAGLLLLFGIPSATKNLFLIYFSVEVIINGLSIYALGHFAKKTKKKLQHNAHT